jgi:hypothetical protein
MSGAPCKLLMLQRSPRAPECLAADPGLTAATVIRYRTLRGQQLASLLHQVGRAPLYAALGSTCLLIPVLPCARDETTKSGRQAPQIRCIECVGASGWVSRGMMAVSGGDPFLRQTPQREARGPRFPGGVRCQGDAASLLRELAGRVGRLGPSHRNPEAFHIEKSEIEAELRRVALALDGGGRR